MDHILLCGISLLGIFIYIIHSTITNQLSINILHCTLIIALPMQLFIHLYFSYTIKHNHVDGISGFYSNRKYRG